MLESPTQRNGRLHGEYGPTPTRDGNTPRSAAWFVTVESSENGSQSRWWVLNWFLWAIRSPTTSHELSLTISGGESMLRWMGGNLYPDSVASKGICWLGSCTVPVGNACKRSPHGSVAVRGTTVWVESQGLALVRPSVRLQSSISGSPAWPLMRQASFRKPRHFD